MIKILFKNVWFWIAIAEFIAIVMIIIILFSSRQSKPSKKQMIRDKVMKEGDVDFGQTIKTAFDVKKAQALYDVLKKRCHPDIFSPDAEKVAIADDLFQEITKNKNNYKKLLELKEIAKEKLNINF
ncbi:MAG: hypothetical protein LKM37_05125 [Bacteroidales bacterium]|jgi:hypothetical protein|nr:hypothetical protein [Bacteroidales bacterium]